MVDVPDAYVLTFVPTVRLLIAFCLIQGQFKFPGESERVILNHERKVRHALPLP